jgi:phage tail-like protein
MAAAKVKGTPFQPRYAHLFLVQFDGITVAEFNKCSEIERIIAIINYAQGGSFYDEKFAGRISFTNITLEGALTNNREFTDWFDLAANAASQSGAPDDEYKKNFDVVVLDRTRVAVERFRCEGSLPAKDKVGPFSNEGDGALLMYAFEVAITKSSRVKLT